MYQKKFYYLVVKLMLEQSNIVRAVTKISSCPINNTSRQGIKLLGISFGSIFRLFSYESSQGKAPSLHDSPDCAIHRIEVCTVDNAVQLSKLDDLLYALYDSLFRSIFFFLKDYNVTF